MYFKVESDPSQLALNQMERLRFIRHYLLIKKYSGLRGREKGDQPTLLCLLMI